MITAERIREAGLRLFADQGYEATPLSKIAEVAGIRTPSIYNHFASKEALFLALVEEVEQDMYRRLTVSLERHATQPVEARLHGLILDTSHFIFQAQRGAFYKRFLLFPPTALKAAMGEINRASEARIDGILHELYTQGRRLGELRDLAEHDFISAFYCLMDGLFSESFLYPRDVFDQRLKGAWSVFWAGVCCRV